jgi:hypothetical protein
MKTLICRFPVLGSTAWSKTPSVGGIIDNKHKPFLELSARCRKPIPADLIGSYSQANAPRQN